MHETTDFNEYHFGNLLNRASSRSFFKCAMVIVSFGLDRIECFTDENGNGSQLPPVFSTSSLRSLMPLSRNDGGVVGTHGS